MRIPSSTSIARSASITSAAFLVAAMLVASCARKDAPRLVPRELWLYYGANFADSGSVETLERVWRRAAKAGYSTIVLADVKFARLGEMDASYFARVRRARALADQLGLRPCRACSRSDARARCSRPIPTSPRASRSATRCSRFTPARRASSPIRRSPWITPTSIGASMRDSVVVIHDNLHRARWSYRVRVAPHRCYHVGVEIRTQGFSGQPLIQAMAGDRPLALVKSLGAKSTQDWTEHDVVFNSQDATDVTIYFGVWHPERGRVEWRDWRIEEVGPVNLLRRPGAPLHVRDAKDGHEYVEGVDFEPLRDPRLGVIPWRGQYEVWHEPPRLVTHLSDGTRLRVSWFHVAFGYGTQVTCCPSELRTLERLRDEAARVHALFGTGRAMMMHDEIRALNQDSSCTSRGLTPGRILAENARDCVALLAGDSIDVWNDMFDPNHNAVRDYALVNGDLAGSWDGLPSSVGIVNWNPGNRGRSLRFFADRGHRQVIAGYYDGPPGDVVPWLEAAAGVPGVDAVMYTTWQGRYDDLEAFAEICRGRPVGKKK
jgi:hypothetical protein